MPTFARLGINRVIVGGMTLRVVPVQGLSDGLTEPVGSGFLSDDPLDRAVAQMTLDLAATGVARVPRQASARPR